MSYFLSEQEMAVPSHFSSTTITDLYTFIFSLISKNESKLIKSPVCLSVCLSPTNRLVYFHEIWYGVKTIEGNLDAIILNPLASIILKWLRFKVVKASLAKLWVPW
jgi:hypothetical protein